MSGDVIARLAEMTALPATALMDELQELGLVADEAVTLADVPNEDGLRAYVAILRRKNK